MKHLKVKTGLAVFFSVSLLGQTSLNPPPGPTRTREGLRLAERGRHGMIACADPLATKVGAEVLKSGGNTVDAAVAVEGASHARAAGTPTLKAIPAPLYWKNYPVDWALSPTDELTIVSGRKTNWFVNPMRERIEDNLPLLLFKAEEQFVLTAKVSVRFKASWDAGGLVVRANDELWGKFCFEFSVKKEPMIVSVVTRKISDDCNSMVIPGDEVYLRLAKIGKAIFFFASRDGRAWDMIRSFTFGQQLDLEIGFFSQSPVGEGCTAVFSDITYSAVPIKNVLEGQ